MSRNTAAAVVVLLAGLACSACGTASKEVSATVAKAPLTKTVWVPATGRIAKASGAGTETLGTFTFRGKLSLGVSCTGRGNLDVEVAASPSNPGFGTNCPITVGEGPTPTDITQKPATSFGHREHRAQIKVDAPAGVHWTVTVGETYAKASTVPTGLQQFPLRRSGVGPESLGTFAMTHGFVYTVATCVGKGTFGIWFNRPELGISPSCLNSRHKATVKTVTSPVSEHRAKIDVLAPVGMKWTVVVFEGPSPSRRSDDPTNVWP